MCDILPACGPRFRRVKPIKSTGRAMVRWNRLFIWLLLIRYDFNQSPMLRRFNNINIMSDLMHRVFIWYRRFVELGDKNIVLLG